MKYSRMNIISSDSANANTQKTRKFMARITEKNRLIYVHLCTYEERIPVKCNNDISFTAYPGNNTEK